MNKPTFTAFDRNEFQQLLFDTAKMAVRAALMEYEPRPAKPEGGPAENKFLTKKQAAQKLGCSTSTIDNAARAGKLERHYVGRSVRFRLEEVLALAQPAEN